MLALVTGAWLVVIGFMQIVRGLQIRREARALHTAAGKAAQGFAGAAA